MASEDYNSWRLQTNEGTRYRFLGTSGSFDYESGEVEWRALIRAQDLGAILNELFPPPVIFGGIAFPRAGTMPGFPAMTAKRISYKAFDPGKPIDVYEQDPAAPVGTYLGFLEITINFQGGNAKDPDPADPRTFLELSSSASGEIIYCPPGDTRFVEESTAGGTGDEQEGGGGIDPLTGEAKGEVLRGSTKINRHADLPVTVLVPTIEWTVRWRQVPLVFFKNILIHRLRIMSGRVNSVSCPFLYNAPPETLLFMGFTHTEQYSWRSSNLETPPIDVEMKFLEKRVVWRGVVCGHNHAWEPGQGWKRVVLGPAGNESPYRLWDFNFTFRI